MLTHKFVYKFPINPARLQMGDLKNTLIKLGIPEKNFITKADRHYILCEDTQFKVLRSKATDASMIIYNLHYRTVPIIATILDTDPVKGFLNVHVDNQRLDSLLAQLFPNNKPNPNKEADSSKSDTIIKPKL